MQLNFSVPLMGRLCSEASKRSRLMFWLVPLTCGATLMTGCSSVAPQPGFIVTDTGNGEQGYNGDGKPRLETSLSQPMGVSAYRNSSAFGENSIVIADTANNRIRSLTSEGNFGDSQYNAQTFAGNGTAGFSGDGGAPTDARLNGPRDVVQGSNNNVSNSQKTYIADTGNNRVRVVGIPANANNPIITTYAGNGTAAFAGEGVAATSAGLSAPSGLFVVGDVLYIADTGNNRVRRVAADGIITTVAGNGTAAFAGDDGQATSAGLSAPTGVFVDGNGTIFIADSGNNRIRRVGSDGVITTVAGGGTGGDGALATAATLNKPADVAVTADRQIIISEAGANKIRRVNAKGILSTVTGTGTAEFGGDGGPATTARLSNPQGFYLDSNENIVVADTGNNRIRAIGFTKPPAANTEGATDVTMSSATLNGTIRRNDTKATAKFEYGLTTDYGQSIALTVQPAQVGDPDREFTQTLSANLTDLELNTTYHYRLVATNSVDTTEGNDVTFTTLQDTSLIVTNTGDSNGTCAVGDCSLREAIKATNANSGADTIKFKIPGAGVQTIQLGSALPEITETVTIDGYSQTGARANTLATGSNAVIKIEVKGTSSINIFGISSANNIIRGLSILNCNNGISIIGNAATGNNVTGNFIGIAADGSTRQANRSGVYISDASDNIIGGATPAERNIISGNSNVGVVIVGDTATGNTVRGNSISANGSLGIDLNADGPTANDAGDADSGPNQLQNFPILISASSSGGDSIISGTLNSTPNASFTVDLYDNAVADGNGYGQGESYLGSQTVSTNANGNTNFTVTLTGVRVANGRFVSATATDADGNTSEFGLAKQVLNSGLIAPTQLRAALGSDKTSVNLTWKSNAVGETGTLVYRRVGDGGFMLIFRGTTPGQNSYTDTSPRLGTLNTYRVFTYVTGQGPSQGSNIAGYNVPADTSLAAATRLRATASGSRIVLSWLDNATAETGYKVFRREQNSSQLTQIFRGTVANQTSYSDINAVLGTTYVYFVLPYQVGTNGAASNLATATAGPPLKVTAPSSVKATQSPSGGSS